MRRSIATALCSLFAVGTVHAADLASRRQSNWHQWRGPNANGTSSTAKPPVEWSGTENIRWKAELPGTGSSTPVVWEDRVYLTTAIPTDREEPADAAVEKPQPQGPPGRGGPGGGRRGGRRGGMSVRPTHVQQFVVLCLDRATGKVVWRKVATEQFPHEGHHRTHGFASMSPTTDGRRLFVSFGSRGIYCLDLKGNITWQYDPGDMRTRAGFGEATSPALHGDSLVVNWDHEGDSSIVCLDANTGKEKWRVPRDEPTTWNTPLILERKGVTQVIVNGTNRARSYDLATGQVIWECGGQKTNPIACPVATEDLVFCMTGYRGYALYAIPLDAQGDITGADKIAWTRDSSTPYVASPVLYDDLLYFTRSRSSVITCVEAATGKELYADQHLAGVGDLYASLGGADGKVYVVARSGVTAVLKHGPKLEVLATNALGEGVDASPVFVGRELFLRGAKHLYCIAED